MKFVHRSPFLKASLVISGFALFLLMVCSLTGFKWFIESEIESTDIFIRSWESTTIHGEAVYNKIKYYKNNAQEIWLMNQSHDGFKAPAEKWDRLAIVIENNVAQFYQLPPGPLMWSNELPFQKINLKVDCRQCHSNGPRAIRPAPDFKSLLSIKESATLFLLNLRIKFYGPLENNLWMQHEVLLQKNFEKLQIPICLKCHSGPSKPWSRAPLDFQQKDTIRFLIEQRQMPPPGYFISTEEREQLSKFLHH